MEKNESALLFKAVSKAFDKKHILSKVTLPVVKGKITVLLGSCGAGKSTLLKMAIGLVKPDSGQIFALGKEVSHLFDKNLQSVRKRFGMLFQDNALFDSMNVFDNIAFPLKHHLKLTKEALNDKVMSLLRLVELENFYDRMPSTLSGGEKKQVALARALALQPEVVLFDEPTSGLDILSTQKINNLILSIQKKLGTTFFIISHDIKSTQSVADYVAILNKGLVVAYDRCDSLFTSHAKAVRQLLHG